MAEAIGLVASVVQLAGTGLKLSQALYQYADGVANADRRIKEVAKEIKLTSFVIEELGNIFKTDDTTSLISDSAVATANETLKECSAVFGEIETTLNKSRKGKMGRLMLPFRESKIELLRNHIDKLKSTLQLLMQVLLHAHQVASHKIDREAEARQRDEIRQLLEDKKNTTKRYEESLRNFAASDSSTEVGDDEYLLDDKESASTVEIKAIGSSVDADSLAKCVDHVRTLLESIERLQQSLANSSGDDHFGHHQTAIGSYFAARAHLDSVLLGSSNKTDPKDTMVSVIGPACGAASVSVSKYELGKLQQRPPPQPEPVEAKVSGGPLRIIQDIFFRSSWGTAAADDDALCFGSSPYSSSQNDAGQKQSLDLASVSRYSHHHSTPHEHTVPVRMSARVSPPLAGIASCVKQEDGEAVVSVKPILSQSRYPISIFNAVVNKQ